MPTKYVTEIKRQEHYGTLVYMISPMHGDGGNDSNEIRYYTLTMALVMAAHTDILSIKQFAQASTHVK